MTQHQTISKTDVEQIVKGIETLRPNKNAAGLCKDSSTLLIKKIVEKYNTKPTLFEFEMGSAREPHYAVVLRIEHFDIESLDRRYSPNEHIIIDPTIRQFSTENYENGIVGVGLDAADNLPYIGFYPPRCPERVRWYHTSNANRDNRDVLAQASVEDHTKAEQPNVVLQKSY